SLSSLILMEFKNYLKKFNRTRLQKAAFYMNILSGEPYFNFKKHKFGPYDNSINIISRKIREFQDYHGVSKTEEARSEEHTSELQSRFDLVCRLLLEKKKNK